MNPTEELEYWKKEFPELDEDEIIEFLEIIGGWEPEQPEQPGLEARKQGITDIEDYTKYW